MVDIADKSERELILQTRRPQSVYPGEPPLGGWYTDEEIEAMVQAIRRSMPWRVGFGGGGASEIAAFEEAFAEYIGTEHAVTINGAGTGLDMSMRCLNLEPGDEVICPGFNFLASHFAVIGQGGTLIFCDIDPQTLTTDPNDVERRITPRTRAIFPVHITGLSAPMDDLLDIAERHPHPKHGPLKVIGDAARACGGTYRGTKIGKKGWMTVFSFHTQKLMTTLGEGGMITTDDPQAALCCAATRRWGHHASTPYWGTNYLMNKVQAAVGLVQLRRLDEMIAPRVKRAHQRTELLKDIPELTLPYEPPDCLHPFYIYPILVPPEWAGKKRDMLRDILRDEYNVGCTGVGIASKYSHLVKKHTEGQEIPVSEEISQRLFCPSLNPQMTEQENEYVCAVIAEAVERVRQAK